MFLEVTSMNITTDYPVGDSVQWTNTHHLCAVNLLPGSTSLEELLNAVVDEGEQASMDWIGLDIGYRTQYRAHPSVAYLLLIASGADPILGTYLGTTDQAVDVALSEIYTDEFAFHVIAKGAFVPSAFRGGATEDQDILWSTNLRGSLQIPPKWRDLGIGKSDEHMAASGTRSYLILLAQSERGVTDGNTTLEPYGLISLRNNTQSYSRTVGRLLEGIE